MKFVGIGDLVLDHYIQENKIIGVNGGKTFANIIFQLSNLGNKTKILGCCGSDIEGDICIQSLEEAHVDTQDIQKISKSTRCFYIYGKGFPITKAKNPLTNEKKWYPKSELIPQDIVTKLQDTDIVLFDELTTKNRELILALHQTHDILIDLGYTFSLQYFSIELLEKTLKNNFKIVNLNKRVASFLYQRLNITTPLQLQHFLNCELLLITQGRKGAQLIYNDILYSYQIPNEEQEQEIDANGAGDMFFASILHDYYQGRRDFDAMLQQAGKYAKEIVTKIGSRGNYQGLKEYQ